VDVAAYLQRIGHPPTVELSARGLRGLHRAHLLSVPFENLDISRGRPLSLEEHALFDKVVRRRRGGFCYELNGLLAALLEQLGFPVTLLSARFCHEHGAGPDFDHLALRVDIDGSWLVDVGSGDGFTHPIPLYPGEWEDGAHRYGLSVTGETWLLTRRRPGEGPERQYELTLQPRVLSDFADLPRVVLHPRAGGVSADQQRTGDRDGQSAPHHRARRADGALAVGARGVGTGAAPILRDPRRLT
jgi:N-hydroxyarylamine O-acetyltransferase